MSNLSEKAVALLKNNAEEVKEIHNAYVDGINGWDSFVKLHTTPPVRFKDFHGNEVRDGEKYWFVDDEFTIEITSCHEGSGINPMFKYFKFEPDAKYWIELNKPCLSVQDVLDLDETSEHMAIVSAPSSFAKELLEIIRKKEAIKS